MRNSDVRHRLTGFSVPFVGGGVQWEATETARASARRVLSFLADRRVLFNGYWQEQASECVTSVLEIRQMLTAEIGGLGDDHLVGHLEAMRAACRQFLDQVSSVASDGPRRALWVAYRELDGRELPLVIGLGELRSAMGIQIGLVAVSSDLDVPDTLVVTLPPPPGSDDGAALNIDVEPPL